MNRISAGNPAIHQDGELNNVTESDRMRGRMARLADATEEIVDLTGQAFYIWDIASDTIEWSRNFCRQTGLSEGETRHLKGRSFEKMLGSQSRETRFGTILSASRDGSAEPGCKVPYQCVYLLHPDPDSSAPPLWIEDTGCWFAGADGKPVRAEGSIRIINERRKREEDLRRQSDFDDLTGLPNRRCMERHLERIITHARQSGQVSSFLILSIDRMDLINDVHGFETGDLILRKLGEIIASKLRADDIVCRFSGAKFGLILKDCPPAEIFDAGERILSAISKDVIRTPNGFVAVSGVIGACFLPHHAETPHAAIHAAFRATRNARMEPARRVCVHSHSAEMVAEARYKAEFSTAVIEAVEEGRIELAFQPVCRKDESVAFHEALVRMVGKDGVVHEAGDFIRVVEELGLVRIVDKHALELVLKTLATHENAVLSVNVSHDTVLDPEWLSSLVSGITAIPGGPERLIVEITESMAITQLAETSRFLENIRTLGCRIAIDDFGAGFTSFANLKQLPVDIVKIDGSFAVNLVDSIENQAFIKALIELTRVFNIETVVEWVEDDLTAEILNAWNVDYQQGHKFGKPAADISW